jgi:hypothetical protein
MAARLPRQRPHLFVLEEHDMTVPRTARQTCRVRPAVYLQDESLCRLARDRQDDHHWLDLPSGPQDWLGFFLVLPPSRPAEEAR